MKLWNDELQELEEKIHDMDFSQESEIERFRSDIRRVMEINDLHDSSTSELRNYIESEIELMSKVENPKVLAGLVINKLQVKVLEK